MDFAFTEVCTRCGTTRSPDGWCSGCIDPQLISTADRAKSAADQLRYRRERTSDRLGERIGWTVGVLAVFILLMNFGAFGFLPAMAYAGVVAPWAMRDIWRRETRILRVRRPSPS